MPGQARRLTRGAIDVCALAAGGDLLAARPAFITAVEQVWVSLLECAAVRPAALAMLAHMRCTPIQVRRSSGLFSGLSRLFVATVFQQMRAAVPSR